MAHAGGRPIEYNDEIPAKAQKYLESCNDSEYVRIKSEGKDSTSFENSIKIELPCIEGLALYLDIARKTVYEWKETYPEFCYIVEKIMASQAKRLFSGSLNGTYNASIAKLMLTKHGYFDRVDATTNGKDLPMPILGGLIKEYGEDKGKN